MITTVKPMSVDHARALAMAYELQRLLEELAGRPEHGPGSPVDCAWDQMDEVLGYLEPLETDGLNPDDKSPRGLRLLVTDPKEYEAHRSACAMRRLATKPWRKS